MRISVGIPARGVINETNGYGYATKGMIESLDRLGYQVDFNDASADVEIWFNQPSTWSFQKGPYKIGYHPWESTNLIHGWSDIMNRCDEIWTPSPLIAQWYAERNNINVPIFVYEHGVEHSWAPREREGRDKHGLFKFLHLGAEAARKGEREAREAFRLAFPNHRDEGVQLTFKVISGWNGVTIPINGILTVNRRMRLPDLQEMFYDHQAYLYPSWGEGFGLTPLQAMATGMPTITLPGWAPYQRFIDPNLSVGHTLEAGPNWDDIHPGKMLKPKLDDVVDAMRYTYDNYKEVSAKAMETAPKVHEEYDWDVVTKQVFTDLERRLETR
jgi:glycosyltransferase involved in cell wall biosynthesis